VGAAAGLSGERRKKEGQAARSLHGRGRSRREEKKNAVNPFKTRPRQKSVTLLDGRRANSSSWRFSSPGGEGREEKERERSCGEHSERGDREEEKGGPSLINLETS